MLTEGVMEQMARNVAQNTHLSGWSNGSNDWSFVINFSAKAVWAEWDLSCSSIFCFLLNSRSVLYRQQSRSVTMKGLQTVYVQGGLCSYSFLPLPSDNIDASLQRALRKDIWGKRTLMQQPVLYNFWRWMLHALDRFVLVIWYLLSRC